MNRAIVRWQLHQNAVHKARMYCVRLCKRSVEREDGSGERENGNMEVRVAGLEDLRYCAT